MSTGGSGCRGAHGAVLAERACRWSTVGWEGRHDRPRAQPEQLKHLAEIDTPVPAGGFLKACDTTGTESADGHTAAAFNLDVTTRLAHILKAGGATVVLTRTAHTAWGRASTGGQRSATEHTPTPPSRSTPSAPRQTDAVRFANAPPSPSQLDRGATDAPSRGVRRGRRFVRGGRR